MTNELIVQEFEPIVKQSGLEKAEQYAAVFAPFMITLKQLSDKAVTINRDNPGVLDAKLAREVRLAMAKNRTASEKVKNDNKAALLAEGNLIQNLYNVIASTSKLTEGDLDEVEKFAENKEKQRRAELAIERAGLFVEYGTDLTGYDLGAMADNVFSDLLGSQKLLHEKRIADAAAAEAARIAAEKAELERQAALKAENERLKAEQEAERAETARLAKIEADKAAAALKAEQDKAAAEKAIRDKKLAEIEAANKAARDKAAAELKASQDAAAKAQAELKAKQDAEAKAVADKLAAEKAATKLPVKQKMEAAITGLSLVLPESEITSDIMTKFQGFKIWALQQVSQL